jgi:TRAP transporter TAXI family solute receptor
MQRKRKSRSRLGVAMLTTAAALVVVGGGHSIAEVAKVITFAVTPEGTSGYLMASAFSKAITDKSPIKKVVFQTFGGAAGWPARMQTGEVNFAQHCGFQQVHEAYYGLGPFKKLGRQLNVRTLATGYGLAFGINVIDPNIKTVQQLKGKTLFAQLTHTDQRIAVEVTAKDAGLTIGKDLKIIPVRSPQEAIQGLLTGRADGMVYGIVPGLTEVQRSRGLHTLPIPDKTLDHVLEAAPVWGTVAIKAGQPPLRPEQPVRTLQIQCGTAAGEKTDADTVYQVTKAIFDNLPDWTGVHPLARQWSLKKALQINVAPYHEGAIRYYKEKGVWTAAMDAKQKALLEK